MQMADNAALAAAVAAAVRRPIWRVLVDWNGDNVISGDLENLSLWVEDIEIDRGLSGGVEAAASLVSGTAGAEAKVTLSGNYQGRPLAWAMSPYNTAPALTGQVLARYARVELGMVTDDGLVYLPQVTGTVRAIDFKSGKVVLTIADPSDQLRAPVTLPYATLASHARKTKAEYPMHIRTQWLIDFALRRNGYGAATHPDTFLSMTCHGSFVAEVGEATPPPVTAITPALTHPDQWWIDGPHGFVAPRGSWNIGSGNPPPGAAIICRDIAVRPLPAGVGMSCWYYAGADHQSGTAARSLVACQYGPSADNDFFGVILRADGGLEITAGLNFLDIETVQTTAGNAIGWHYIGAHIVATTSGAFTVKFRFDDTVGTGTIPRPPISATLYPFTDGSLQAPVPVSDATMWTSLTPPADDEWPGADYNGSDIGQMDLGVNMLSWLPERVGVDSWSFIQEAAAAEAGTVGFGEDGKPFFLDRNTLTAETSTIERVVTSSRELASLDIGLSTDTVRNVAEVETVDAQRPSGPGAQLAVFSSIAEDMFDTPASSTRDYIVWVEPFSQVNRVPQSLPVFTTAAWEAAEDGAGVRWGYACVRIDTNAEVTTGVTVTQTPAGPRRIRVRVVNANGYAVRLATTSGRPALRITGYPIVRNEPRITRIEKPSSFPAYGERSLDLGGSDWDQDADTRALLASSLLGELRRPVPVLPDIDVVGDPRLQLTDTTEIRDPGRLADSIIASVVDLKRRLNKSEGLRDTYGVRPILPDDGVVDPDPPLEEEYEPIDPGDPGEPEARPYFQDADWHWDPIPASPVLDAQSAAIVTRLGDVTKQHIMNIVEFGCALRGPDGITSGTQRYSIPFDYDDGPEDSWGPAFPSGATMPIPSDVDNNDIADGGDGHLSVADPTTNGVYSLWIAEKTGSSWKAGWGGYAALDGEGRETVGGSTGSGISRFACVIREAEIAAGEIPHALFFASNMVKGPNGSANWKYPATKTDGQFLDASVPDSARIWEGSRVQLNPALDPDDYDLNPGERAIFIALQVYGAYCGDNGGNSSNPRMAFLCEYSNNGSGDPGAGYQSAGIDGDYYNLSAIPWNQLRVLKNWDGSA